MHRPRVTAVCALALGALLAGAPTALASSSGGAALGPKSHPKGSERATASTAVFTRKLRIGQSGDDIKTLQTWLSEVGYPVAIDGSFGPLTRTAVTEFQLAHRLSPASGAVGPRT